METQHISPVPHLEAILQLLQELHGALCLPTEVLSLAHAIAPYVARSNLPLHIAVCTILPNYLQEGRRVQQLLANPDAMEWQAVLTRVITFATHHSLAPDDGKVVGAPDLDAYADIRRKLASYNFEAPLDGWITVIVTRRLQRFWRDRTALQAGGSGFKERTRRETSVSALSVSRKLRVTHHSFDGISHDGFALRDTLAMGQPSVAEVVEAREFANVIADIVDTYAGCKHDPVLAQIWSAVFDHNLKLREAADYFGLSISQIYGRLKHIRDYLRQDVRLRQWLDLPEEGQAL